MPRHKLLPTEEIYNLNQGAPDQGIEGLSYAKLARMFRCSKTTIKYHVQKQKRINKLEKSKSKTK